MRSTDILVPLLIFFFGTFLWGCSTLNPDPAVNTSLTSSYAEMRLQLRSTKQLFATYRGQLSQSDVAKINQSILDTEDLILPEIDRILMNPNGPQVTAPQVSMLETQGTEIYRNVKSVIDANQALLKPEDEEKLTQLGAKLRQMKYYLDVSRQQEQMKQETIQTIFTILKEGLKVVADIAL